MVNVIVATTGNRDLARDTDRLMARRARGHRASLVAGEPSASITPTAARGRERESKRRATVETDEYETPGRARRGRA